MSLLALKSAVAAIITQPAIGRLLGRLYGDRIPSHGLRIDTSGNVSPRIKAYLFWGLYESAEVRFVRRHLRPDLDVVELGSSLGVISCLAAKRLKGRRVICVEANPSLTARLRDNLRLNGVAHAEVLHAAVSYHPDASGMARLRVGVDNTLSALQPDDGDAGVPVPARTLSQILAEFQVGDYTLMSDIEGAEAAILRHDAAALRRCRQMIIELHDAREDGVAYDVPALAALATAQGFAIRASYGPVYVFEREQAQ